ncbi:hypothetical protein MAM1_0034c02595 [Mucor ambiguus]|uniref:Uncharacterized protein n=1 Tax=Mucor ambiguus TaxID=91626 RepID=A0A0C9M7V5_9FUNG|nr:hypothetical protein MAM1_0034c02595 [Mucor ambiguus]
MGVQDVVARLNKSKSANTPKLTNNNIPPVPKRKIVMPVDDKRLPPSPAMSPTSTIISSNRKDDNTPTASGIASMMQRFEQTSPLPNTSTTTPSHAPSAAKLPSPPESPSQQQNKLHVTQKPRDAHSLFKFDATASEIVDLFQTLLDQNAAAEEYIKTLKQDVEKYASDATKVRDYEIRVEYLALKLEQVSEERDYFEKELNELAHKQKQNTIMSSPLSPAFSQIDQRDIVIEDEQKLQSQNNDAYMADLLNVYEEISDQDDHEGGDDMQLFDEQSASQIQSQQEEIEILNDKLIECDRGVQITLMKYVADLETQRLEAKALKQVVKKQDELITKLETKIKEIPENPDELLKEQVEVQRVELENKRELLAQLLNEREDLLRRLNSNQRNSILRRSSIELLTNIINNRPASYSSVASSSGRGTPPLTAPPKQPLPPLPSPTSSSSA